MPRGFVPLALLVAAMAVGGPEAEAQRPTASRGASVEAGDTRASGSLPFFYDLYTFRGDGGRTNVIAAFAVPVERLREEDEAGEVRYRFDVTLVLSDTALHSVSRTDDSVYVSVPGSLAGEHLLHTHVELEAPPSNNTLQRVLMFDATTAGIGQLYGTPFTIPDYSGRELMLSDIALGLPEAQSGWERGDVTLALLPTSQFPQSSFDVYYEVYNLPVGHRYATDISVDRVDPGGIEAPGEDMAVHTRFVGEASPSPDGVLAELRRIDASLDEGFYRLSVTVTDEATGDAAHRDRTFRVRGWGPGITMVPALPSARGITDATRPR